jgi:hypothetical protein
VPRANPVAKDCSIRRVKDIRPIPNASALSDSLVLHKVSFSASPMNLFGPSPSPKRIRSYDGRSTQGWNRSVICTLLFVRVEIDSL